jgi:isopentenyl-diphosphate delta-isomerase
MKAVSAIACQLILVDEHDRPVGTCEKMEAHQKGLLHRAFSIFIFNRQGQMLLQQRALGKYHSGGSWTNACCSHPFPTEENREAALRRLQEEMGFTTPLVKVFDFCYRADLDNGLTEYEFDHVFVGIYEGPVSINREEAMDYCYKSMQEIEENITLYPTRYTPWFRIAFPRVNEWHRQQQFQTAFAEIKH